MDQINLTSLITPAIAISILAYLTHFFGKVIEDQNSFADDKKWSIELRGILFMIDVIPSAMVGVYLASLKPWGDNQWWFHLIALLVISIITGTLQLSNTYLVSKYFNILSHNLEELEKKTSNVIKIFANVDKYISVGLISTILFYLGTLEYLSKNLYFIFTYFPIIFFIFILLASNFSLKKARNNKMVPVDIYFTDQSRDPLKNVVVLKYNSDNIRVRTDNKVLFLNKNEVFKIEMVIPNELL